jgi:hypothetical protein
MQKYSELLKKYDDLKQYSITFPGDYSEQIAVDVGKAMNIPIDTEIIKNIIWNRRRKRGEESICFFNNISNQRCFILLDCNPGDWIYSITARCTAEDDEKVSKVLLKWFNFCLREEKQSKQYEILENNMFHETNPLLETVKRHNLDKL